MSLNLPTDRDYTKSIYWPNVQKIMIEKWCPHCYRMGCMHCNGTGFIVKSDKQPQKPKAGHPEPTKHVELTKWEVEDKVFEAAYRRWERSWAKRKQKLSFDEFIKMEL